MKRSFLALFLLLIAFTAHAQIKVLGIGNSFSEDALEQNISEIAVSEGVPMIIANLYIGGCSIDRHLENIEGNKPLYRYTKFDAQGKRAIKEKVTLESVIGDEKWDYISVQQVSGQSGIYESYAGLPELISWIKKKVPEAKILLHHTWAYAVDSKHADFPNYESSQATMFSQICKAVQRVKADNKIDVAVPTGPAIQYLRQATNDYNHTRDGFHLSLGMGRYTASCTWFATLTGRNVSNIKYYPDGSNPRTTAITETDAQLCRQAASKAVRYWVTIPQMSRKK